MNTVEQFVMECLLLAVPPDVPFGAFKQAWDEERDSGVDSVVRRAVELRPKYGVVTLDEDTVNGAAPPRLLSIMQAEDIVGQPMRHHARHDSWLAEHAVVRLGRRLYLRSDRLRDWIDRRTGAAEGREDTDE